jgi:hypothetical protein
VGQGGGRHEGCEYAGPGLLRLLIILNPTLCGLLVAHASPYPCLCPPSPQLSDEAVRSHDLFMAELSALLSRAMRHVIAPPTATWTHAAGHLHSTATPFTPHVRAWKLTLIVH